MQLLIFYLLGAGTVITAMFIVFSNRSVNAAISMVGTMFCVAGLYVLLDAHLIAALQIIVYAGAIMVLFLFVIMLLNLTEKEGHGEIDTHNVFIQFLGICLAGFIFIKVVGLFKGTMPVPSVELVSDFGTVKEVGKVLYTKFILPFEIASILLLAAIVGAVTLAKKKVK
ncbi:MAG: NADH-quinone oxidoreductase subunit J [Thermodesulfobacteriota bacterium]